MIKEKNKSKKFALIVLLISVLLLGSGLFLDYMSNPKRLIAKSLTNIDSKLNKVLTARKETIGTFGNYTTTSEITFDISSPAIEEASKTSPGIYDSYITKIENLSKTKTNLKVVKDKEKERLFLELDSKLDTTPFLKAKYLIENATEYFFIENYTPEYVNNGNKTYFESQKNDVTTSDNLDYLTKIVLESVLDNLTDNDFKKSTVTMTINTKEDKYLKTTLILDQKRMLSLEKSVLKDLKEDSKANKILTGIFPDFKNKKITNDDNLLKEKEELTINIYTDKFGFSIKKYELIDNYNDKPTSIVYEPNTKEEGTFYLLEENKIISKILYSTKEKETSFKLLSSTDEEKGSLTFTYDAKNYKVELNIKAENKLMTGVFSSTISNIKKSKNYDEKITISYKETSSSEELINFASTIKSKTTSSTKIDEDLSKSILRSTLSSEEEAKLSNILTELTRKLEKKR